MLSAKSLENEQISDDRYLIFRVGTELFGTKLLQVREVIGYQTPKPIPNTSEYFLGVINIRGEIVGMIDLRIRFGSKAEIGPLTSMMVFNTEHGSIAAVVDNVDSVQELSANNIQNDVNVVSAVSQSHLKGIARIDTSLVSIIDLEAVLESTNFVNIKGKTLTALEEDL